MDLEYPCLEIIVNGQKLITFTNLNFDDVGFDYFVNTFENTTKDHKIFLLLKNNFIKPGHVDICRTQSVIVIFHKNDYTGKLISL